MKRRTNTCSGSDRRGRHTRSSVERATNTTRPTSVGLFAGIGGIELGLHAAGFETVLMSEIEPSAQAVLEERFPGVELHGDIRTLRELPVSSSWRAGSPARIFRKPGALLASAERTPASSARSSACSNEKGRLSPGTESEETHSYTATVAPRSNCGSQRACASSISSTIRVISRSVQG